MAPCRTLGIARPGQSWTVTAPAQADQDGSSRAESGYAASLRLLLVLDVADNVGDVLVAFLLLLNESGVVDRLIFELDIVVTGFGRFRLADFLSLCFRVGFF